MPPIMKKHLLSTWISILFVSNSLSTGVDDTVTPPDGQKNCSCQWTPWMNGDDPNKNFGVDTETYASLRNKGYNFCEKPTDIQCYNIASQGLVQPGDFGVVCSLETGLTCSLFCDDYKIRVACCYCPPKAIATTSMSASNTPTTDTLFFASNPTTRVKQSIKPATTSILAPNKPTTDTMFFASSPTTGVKQSTKPVIAKVNTAIIASIIGGCVILITICIVIVFVMSRRKRRTDIVASNADETEHVGMTGNLQIIQTHSNPPMHVDNSQQLLTSQQQDDDINPYSVTYERDNQVVETHEDPRTTPQRQADDVNTYLVSRDRRPDYITFDP